MEAGLFEILQGHFMAGARITDLGEHEQRIQSIVDNLTRLFNTRRGALAHLPDYGLPDVSQIYREMPNSVGELQKSIEQAIRKYEPRLHRLHVQKIQENEEERRLTFMISAEVGRRGKVKFQTIFSSDQSALVNRYQRQE